MKSYLMIACLFVLWCEKLKDVNFLKSEKELNFYYANNDNLLRRILNNVEKNKDRTNVDKSTVLDMSEEKLVTIDKETKEENILKNIFFENIMFDQINDENLKIDRKEKNIDEKKKKQKENELIKDTTIDNDVYSYTNDMITMHKKKLKEEKNFVMIKEFVKFLSSREENVLISNVNFFLKRIFNLILREKIITGMCPDEQKNEEIEKVERKENIGVIKNEDPKNYEDKEKNKETTHDDVTTNYDDKEKNDDDKDNYSEYLKKNKNCNLNKKLKIKDCNKNSVNCFFSNIKNEEFYKAPDLFKYYISLERILKSSSIRSKTDRISKYFTFYPVSLDKEYYEEKINNDVFIEAVRSILFDSHEGNKKNKKKIFSSFIIVVDTLISLIKEEKVVNEMYMFIHLFFQDLNLLNKKILDILLKSSFNPGKTYYIPDFNKQNFEFILSKIYTKYVLNNLLNRKFNNQDTINMSQFLNNKIKPFNFSFIENNVHLLKNQSVPIKDDDLLISEENLCKYIPIKKKLLYEKLNKTRQAAEEAILDYIFRLLLRKLHEFIIE
ncbi:conserved Plasmodium protein, unknown function [Plasmodium sp. gorilla clade G2]|uniref:conserved Plasmodium protein, unknown function n=1 Tax=Plasmodium sp. gorilla clade G2 TaxID=880535 RepID=UPI000D1FE663|nr:conserved Plasmodium protein, unknown function [Plasmodium sp. gorilla clade G2]SOV11176.1 conserved Plasmodium protein, unknown function [Plasmodium sp. gorilla clade G2]